jgi:NAD(P)-dependent dehydrogenase (short-subunit alcohol dehydrogenase family)
VSTTLDGAAVRALAPAEAFSLAGRVALVTGAAGGLGSWLAAGLGAAGARVVLSDVDRPGLEAVRATLADAGVQADTLPADLLDDAAPRGLVDDVLERAGRLDVLVNNAGVNRREPMLEVDPATYDRIMRLDLRAPYFLSQAAAGAMRAADGGAIVSIGSVNSVFGLEHNSVYGPAKAGLSQLTRVMALEWAADGIRANCIAPGFLDTPLARPLWESADTSRWLRNRVPLRRAGRPDEVVGLCQLLASPAGSFLTGQTFVIDGGFSAGGRWFTPDE